jgi:hypothetical protein
LANKLTRIDYNPIGGATSAEDVSYNNTTSGLTADNVQTAIDEIVDLIEDSQSDVADLVSLSGVPANSTDLGAFSGSIIPDNSNNKQALQSLETAIETLPDPFFYAGTWDATTNTPDLDQPSARVAGAVYYVSVGGTHDFGAFGGSITFSPGDKVVFNGTTWDKWDVIDEVVSVFGRTGAVVAVSGDYTASQITNVPAGTIVATTVQAAIAELDSDVVAAQAAADSAQDDIDNHIAEAVGAHAASAISYDNTTSGLTADEVQAAIDELAAATPSGTPDTVAGFDTNGDLYSLPTWNYDTKTNGLNSSGTTPGTDETNLNKVLLNTNMGDGVSGSVDNFSSINISDSTNANYDVNNYVGINHAFNVTNGAAVNAATGVNTYLNGEIIGNAQGVRVDSQMEAQNVSAFVANMQGTVNNQLDIVNLYSTANVENNIFVINSGNNGNSTSGIIYGFNFGNQGTAANFNATNTFNSADMVSSISGYTFSNQGDTQNFQGYSVNNSGAFDNLTAINLSNSGVGANSITGVQVSDNSNSPTANITGVDVNVSGTYNDVTGIRVNVSGATASISPLNRKVGVNVEGGSINGFLPFTTLSDFPGAVDGGNSLVTAFTVEDGSPVENTSVLANNFSGLVTFNDDYSGDPFYGLGYAMVGYVGQVSVADTKTADKVSMAIAGASIPGTSTGGTITECVMYNALGLLPGGGTISVDKLYGLKVDAGFSTLGPTEAFGVYIDDPNAASVFKGDITNIRGVDTSFPASQGAAGTVLTNDGSGNLTWQAAAASKYVSPFNNTTDWTLVSGFYEITITAATHGLGTSPAVSVFELDSGNYIAVGCVISVSAAGNVTIQVTGTPDNRFEGKLVIV